MHPSDSGKNRRGQQDRDKYLDVVRRRNEAEAKLKALLAVIRDVLAKLDANPERVSFGGSHVAVLMPGPAPEKINIDPLPWPSATQIKAALDEWQKLRVEAHTAYAPIPQDLKQGLQPPR